MIRTWLSITAAAALVAASLATPAGAVSPSKYTVKDLLEPCVEGDNDSRWGAAAEAECEQYIMGFTDAFVIAATPGSYCLPEQNRADEVRWAFMRWAHQNFEKRDMPAAKGLQAVVEEKFRCR